MKRSPLTKTDVERKYRQATCFDLLIQARAVLVLECQSSVGSPAPSWIQSYKSPHTAGIRLKKISNSLPVWQVAFASITSPIHSHHVEIEGAQYQDVNSVGCIDLYAAIYAEVCEGGGYVGDPVAVSIGPDESKCSYAYFDNHIWAGYASIVHAAIPNEELHRRYIFKISQIVHSRSSRSIGKIKALRQSIERKLPTTIKHIPAALRGSDFREQVEISNDESSRTASSTDIPTRDNLGELAMGHKNLSYITKFTKAYLSRADVQARISECAKTLVERRRCRQQLDPGWWDRECYGLRYQCVHGDCAGNDVEYADRFTLIDHLSLRHPDSLQWRNLTSMVNNCMSVVL